MSLKILKFHYPVLLISIVLVLLTFTLVKAVDAPPPKVCGDGIVQSPNSNNEFEKCDDGTGTGSSPIKRETERCTADCGQKLLGFGWVNGAGWVSLNDDNCNGIMCGEDMDQLCGDKYVDRALLAYLDSRELTLADLCSVQTKNYYVQVTAGIAGDPNNNGEISGWGWSDNLGWICFGSTCTNPQPRCSKEAVLNFDDPQNPQVFGWAQALALEENGWLSLNYRNGNPACTAVNCSSFNGQKNDCLDNGCQYNLTDTTCTGYTTRLVQQDFGGVCSNNPSQKCDPKEAAACDPAEDDYCCSSSDGSCVSEQRLTLAGWAWNSNSGSSGLGWLWFDPEIAVVPPWLQTKYGDIYARGGIIGDEPPGYNATYRILANNDIVHFLSARGVDKFIDPNFGAISFPTLQTRYSNALGQIDIDGLVCTFSGDACINKYGTSVVKFSSLDDLVDILDLDQPTAKPLAGKIYYYEGDLTIDQELEFKTGREFENGAGTIIIKGNLTVSADITYCNAVTCQATRFKNLPSVAWIIQGDLQVSHQVEKLAGNFIVIGDKTALPCEGGDTIVPRCGQIFSCFDNTGCGDMRLTVSGLMMARKFYLKRTYTQEHETPIEGSEIIIYDGRLLANTPPGLGDFVKSLPIWRSGVFSR